MKEYSWQLRLALAVFSVFWILTLVLLSMGLFGTFVDNKNKEIEALKFEDFKNKVRNEYILKNCPKITTEEELQGLFEKH